MRLEYRNADANSKKFWDVVLGETTVTVHFGRIDTEGQTCPKEFASPEAARKEYRRLVCEKLAKGYKPAGNTVNKLLANATVASDPAVIDSLYIGENIEIAVIQDICGWMTACIQHGMMPKQFAGTWEKFLKEEKKVEGLGHTKVPVGKLFSEELWLDVCDFSEGGLDELYAKAVAKGGDRFIWHDNTSYFFLVAMRGDPGARAIELCVLQEDGCKGDDGQWLNDWPAELDQGAPIASMSFDDATLRDGRKIVAP